MRVLITVLVLAAAAPAGAPPAAAQDYRALLDAREGQREAEADAARRRDVELTNQLSRLDAQARTEQGLRDLQALGQPPATPQPSAHAPLPIIDTSRLASIPDAVLAASNARVRAAAANRR